MKGMNHLDLFSGIGGFALAVDTVWPGSEHTFVDNDSFCQAILKKHWPNSPIYGDIRQFINVLEVDRSFDAITDTETTRRRVRASVDGRYNEKEGSFRSRTRVRGSETFLLTGGFPCQPFSQAGRRKGTSDNRYLWPEMFRVIQLTQPTFVIAENVRGLLTQGEGVVFEQVCTDLESEGYEVQPIIIPAVAVNAPHRRDRIWFIAHLNTDSRRPHEHIPVREGDSTRMEAKAEHTNSDAANPTNDDRRGGRQRKETPTIGTPRNNESTRRSWNENWIEVATRLCTLDDGLPNGLVRPKGWRNAALKAAGNAIVPQVAIEIMKAIRNSH